MKILHLDLETSPNTAYVWGLFKQNISIKHLIGTGRVMCLAAKWHGQKDMEFYAEWDNDGHEGMIHKAYELINEADAVVHYYGSNFDIPVLNAEFAMYGLTPPSPIKQIDLCRVVRRNFRFPSNKLDYVAQRFDLGSKTAHEGFQLWIDCMAGKPAAQKKMGIYNRQDVRLLEKLYNKLLPWINNHPNHGLHMDSDKPVCPNCGGTHLQKRGISRTKTLMYQRYHCNSCGTWSRARLTCSTPEDKSHILVG